MPRTKTPIRTNPRALEMFKSQMSTPELSLTTSTASPSVLDTPEQSWNFGHRSNLIGKDNLIHVPRHRCEDQDLESLLEELNIPDYTQTLFKKETRVLEIIGEGTHAQVHRALLNGREVAAKVASSKSADTFIKRELEVLDHICSQANDLDHIIEHYTLETIGERNVLFLELADGDLMDEIESMIQTSSNHQEPLPGKVRWYSLARQMHAAIVALHNIGVIHGDVKPQNFLLISADCVKLSDFETAFTPNGPLRRLTTNGFDIVGSTAYSASELLRSANAVPTFESDIFSLGVSFFVLASGEEPYARARTGIELLLQSQSGDPLRFSSTARLTSSIQAIVRGCCTKDPAKRWTHEQITEALKQS